MRAVDMLYMESGIRLKENKPVDDGWTEFERARDQREKDIAGSEIDTGKDSTAAEYAQRNTTRDDNVIQYDKYGIPVRTFYRPKK